MNNNILSDIINAHFAGALLFLYILQEHDQNNDDISKTID